LKKNIQYHLWSFLWGLLIIFLTVIPGALIPKVPAFIDLFKPDKLVHLFVFGVFIFLLMYGILRDERMVRFKVYAAPLALNIGFLLSGLTEIMQKYWISGRVASVYDFVANVAGCLIGWWVFQTWEKTKSSTIK
jgi:hypothetical protein